MPFNVFIAAFFFTAALTIEPIREFLFGKMDEIDPDGTDVGRNARVNKRGTLEHVPVLYGQTETGGILNFKGVAGTNNEYLYLEYILGEGECQSLIDVLIDEESYTDPKYSSSVQVTFYPGTDSHAADPDLVANFADYTSDDRGRGLCKAVVRLTYDQENLAREPDIVFRIQGKKIYDPRTTTTVYSANPALCVRDYLLSARYGAGYKITTSDIVEQDWIDAANHCETQIESYTGSGSNINIYEMHASVDTEKPVRDNILAMMKSFHAHLVRDGDLHRFLIEKDDATVLDLTHDNIIDNSITYAVNDVDERYNEFVCDFRNEEKKYISDQKSVSSAALLTADNSIKSVKKVKNWYDTNQYRIEHYCNIELKRSRQGIAVGLTASEEAFKLLPGAIVRLTLDEPGWSLKKFRVIRIKQLAQGNVAVNLLEHESTAYDRTVPVEAPTPPDTYLPNPFSVAQVGGLSAVSGISHVVANSAGDLSARVKVTWTPLADVFVTHYELRARLDGETDWIDQTPAIGRSASTQYVVGFEDGDLIDIQVRAINSRQVVGAWSQTLQHTVEGVSGPPPDVTTFNVFADPDGTRVATFDMTSPPIDLAGYKIRYSSNTSEVWANMELLHEGLITQSPFEFNLLSEGDYRFAIKAYDRGGRESVNATYVTAELPVRRLGQIIRTDNARGQDWPGTLTNCRIEESDNSLVGTTNTTWDTATNTWDSYNESWFFDTVDSFTYQYQTIDIGALLTFNVDTQIELSFGSSALIEMRYSDDNATWSAWADVSTTGLVTGQYVQVRITVTNTGGIPKLDNLTIYLGGDSKVDYFRLLDTSGLTVESGGGVRIPIRSNFSQITDVNLTIQGDAAFNGKRPLMSELVDLDATNGPHVRFYDKDENQIYPTITAQVIGV